jgi:hypothetical protein
VVRKTVVPRSARSREIVRHRASRLCGSSPAVGSSRNRTAGSWTSARDVRAPLLTAGEGSVPAAEDVLQSDELRELVDPDPGTGPGDALHGRAHLDVLAHREQVVEHGGLEHDADGPAHRVVVAADRVTENLHRAGVGRQQRGEAADRGRLAGTVGAEEREQRTGRDLEPEAVDGAHRSVGPDQVLDRDRRRCGHGFIVPGRSGGRASRRHAARPLGPTCRHRTCVLRSWCLRHVVRHRRRTMTPIEVDPDLVTQAYLYGFPLVFNLDQVRRYVTEGVGANPAAPFNSFSHARTLAGPSDTFVTINNDTVYSMGQVDLSVGPVRLHVPDTHGRYYVLQFVDAWTNNFAYVGHRATGTEEGDFLLVPPGWAGEEADGSTVIEFPTMTASIVGRWAVGADEELPIVHALQDATTLTQVDPDAVAVGLAEPDEVPDGLGFLEKLRVWSQQLPPADRDKPLQAGLAPLGVNEPGPSPYSVLDVDSVRRLASGLQTAQETLHTALVSGASPQVNGWKLTFHAFDYNLDFFEVGALDDDAFKIADPKLRIVERAAAAIGGLWGNHPYEAAYIMTYLDDRGEQLNGSRTYTLRLDPPPPVKAFWSLTMYSVPDFYLIENPIDRYSVGDRTPDITFDADGALTITISHQRPTDPQAAANWLPAPVGDFRPVMRMYEPDASVLDGSYVFPAITRVGGDPVSR